MSDPEELARQVGMSVGARGTIYATGRVSADPASDPLAVSKPAWLADGASRSRPSAWTWIRVEAAFSRTFKKIAGVSPAAWRERCAAH
jgi:hypothetical protein